MMAAFKITILCIVASLVDIEAKSLCPSECRCSLTTVDCQGQNISNIPSGIPEGTRVLFIRNTKISKLDKDAFVRLHALRSLSLMSNMIFKIDAGAFDGLPNLNFLDLHGNNLTLSNEVYHAGVFRNLSNLMTLWLHDNSKVSGDGLEYPDEIGASLPKLANLTMDGLNISFPDSFYGLEKLTNLSLSGISGRCKLTYLLNITFEPLRATNLRNLDITNCAICYVEANSLTPLRSLETLNISRQKFPSMETVSHIFYGIRNNTNIRYLVMNAVMTLGSYSLTLDSVCFLACTNVTHFYFNDNFMTWASSNFYNGFPKTIEIASFLGNYFLSSNSFLFYLHKMTNLVSLSVSIRRENIDLHATVFVPPSLKYFTISGVYSNSIFKGINVSSPNNVHYVAWVDSVIPELRGSLVGLQNLTILIMTNIYCNYVSPSFLQKLNSLNYLNMSRNFLGEFIAGDVNCLYLKGLEKLEILDLSNNVIRQLPHCMFKYTTNLKEIHMQNNALIDFNVSVSSLKHLTHLNLASNQIAYLSKIIRDELIPFIKQNNLRIDMGNNHLMCSCDTLDFLKWLQEYQFNFASIAKYVCFFPNNTRTTLSDLNTTVVNLDRECETFNGLLMGTVVFLTTYIIVILSAVVYKQRMHFFYWYHTVRRPASRVPIPVSQGVFRFDAFVSFADSESDFILRSLLKVCEDEYDLKLCIHFRDFIPGTMIAENIVNAIHFSRKTIVILSNAFLKSDWCMYEFNMARMENIYSGRETLIIIKYEDVDPRNVTLDILEAMKSQTYGVLPRDHQDMGTFWRLLVAAIKCNDM